ncbi:MAG TPA: inositol monophosphatase family protein [Herpetosiphonaceae bacterium]
MRESAIAIARAAGAVLRDGLSRERTIERKSASVDLVTDIDLASERVILAGLREQFPGHRVVAEESGDDARESEYCWVIDPLDGTTNYAHGYPAFCVSMGLLVDGQPSFGVVYDPIRDECFVAERGRGAYLNERPLRVSATASLGEALLSTGFPYSKRTNPDNNIAEMSRIVLEIQGVRRSGSAALDLCYVAAGRSDGHWELGLAPWDTAAGAVLVSEAGGALSTWGGAAWQPWIPKLVATNGSIHAELLALLVPRNPAEQ